MKQQRTTQLRTRVACLSVVLALANITPGTLLAAPTPGVSASTDTATAPVDYATVEALCNMLRERQVAKSADGTDASYEKSNAFCGLQFEDLNAADRSERWRMWDMAAIPTLNELKKAASLTKEPNLGLRHDITPSVGGSLSLNESAVLWGLTDFIVERVRENLYEYGLSHFIETTCDASKGGQLLPQTCSFLEPFRSGGAIPGLSALRSAVQSDLTYLPRSVLKKLAIQRRDTDGDVVITLLEAAYVAYAIQSRPGLLSAIAVASDSIDALEKNSKPAFQRLDLTTTRASAMFYELSVFARVLQGTSLRRDSRERNIQFGDAVRTILINVEHSPWRDYWPVSSPVANSTCPVVAHVLSASTANTAPAPASEAPKHCDRLLLYPMVKELGVIVQTIDDAQAEVEAAREAGNSTQALKDAKLAFASSVVDAAFGLGQTALMTASPELYWQGAPEVGALHQAVIALLHDQYATAAQATLFALVPLAVDSAANLGKMLQSARPAIVALADVAAASDADGVTAALNRIAAPRRGFLRKRGDKLLYFSVNAYAGAIAGSESANGDTARFIAPFMPVGLEAGVRLTSWLSAGVYGYVIDIGALGSYRLKSNTSVDKAPEVGFKQVFSPGIGLVFGFLRIPLSAGWIRASASPSLRRITDTDPAQQVSAVRRDSFFIAMDIPLY